MLKTLDGKEYMAVPRQETFRLLSKLTDNELMLAKAELNEKIEGNEVHTAGWMPGSDWEQTPFQPIYEKAAHRDQNLAAKIFGLLVFQTFIEHPEQWYFIRQESDDGYARSLTYFRARN